MNYLVIKGDLIEQDFNDMADAIIYIRDKVKTEPGVYYRVYSEVFNTRCFDQNAVRNESLQTK